ncbi:MAG TPA: dihydrodipicolinate synthase family protein [Dehalococcoidia bacterium]|nr:dihydrodipicolinate synthase family protein [Dehalococcoidia bacterium]
MSKEIDLAGLIPAVATPMHEGGAVDEESLRLYIRWLLAFEGLKAVAVNMDTGEGPQLLPGERRRILDVWVAESAGRVPVFAGVGAPNTQAAVELARDAQEAGADGLVVFPHPAFVGEPLPPEVPYEYHRAIADAVPLPMVIFQLQPSLAGVLFSREALLKLASISSVVAIKEASFDAVRFVETIRILQDAPRRIQVLTGNDNFIFESFLLGADGALIGFGTLAVAEQIEMFRLCKEGHLPEARRIYDDVVQPLVTAVFAPPVRDYRARTKEALVELGVIPAAHTRPPLLSIPPDDRERLLAAVRSARLAMPAGTS